MRQLPLALRFDDMTIINDQGIETAVYIYTSFDPRDGYVKFDYLRSGQLYITEANADISLPPLRDLEDYEQGDTYLFVAFTEFPGDVNGNHTPYTILQFGFDRNSHSHRIDYRLRLPWPTRH
jgi:hypothetical protein